eukprot:1945591-Rhodomonas_salina.3
MLSWSLLASGDALSCIRAGAPFPCCGPRARGTARPSALPCRSSERRCRVPTPRCCPAPPQHLRARLAAPRRAGATALQAQPMSWTSLRDGRRWQRYRQAPCAGGRNGRQTRRAATSRRWTQPPRFRFGSRARTRAAPSSAGTRPSLPP